MESSDKPNQVLLTLSELGVQPDEFDVELRELPEGGADIITTFSARALKIVGAAAKQHDLTATEYIKRLVVLNDVRD